MRLLGWVPRGRCQRAGCTPATLRAAAGGCGGHADDTITIGSATQSLPEKEFVPRQAAHCGCCLPRPGHPLAGAACLTQDAPGQQQLCPRRPPSTSLDCPPNPREHGKEEGLPTTRRGGRSHEACAGTWTSRVCTCRHMHCTHLHMLTRSHTCTPDTLTHPCALMHAHTPHSHTHMHTNTNTLTCAHRSTCSHTHVHTDTHHTHAHTHTSAHLTRSHTYMYTDTCTHHTRWSHTHMHTHTSTHDMLTHPHAH